MSGEEFVLSIVALVMGCGVLIVGITKITGLIQSWINRNNSSLDEATFERLAKAFVQHKKQSDRRIQNLEAIISDDKNAAPKQIDEPKSTIEIEDKKERQSESDNDSLNNMLRE